MLDITDKNGKPDLAALAEYMDTPLFSDLLAHMEREHAALCSVEYSGDKVLLGWDLRFRKGGRTLLRLYPRRGWFTVLLVVGPREKPLVEARLGDLSPELRQIYEATGEGMGQRWLLLDLHEDTPLYRDALALAALRRQSARPQP